MSQALIRRALESTLNTWAAAQSPAIPVAWENVDFEPPATRYLRAFLLPSPTVSRDLGRVNRNYTGLMQISVVVPLSTGAGAAETIVAALAALFPPATPITSVSGITLWIREPLSPARGIEERDRFHIPCSLLYAADVY